MPQPKKSAARIVKEAGAAKARAVFVDSASLSHMRRPLGIGEFNFRDLFEVLTKKIGGNTPVKAFPPVCVISSDKKLKNVRMGLGFSGFEVVPVEMTRGGGEDDAVIIQKIEALDPKKVNEIVIVSADSGYLNALLAKKAQGVERVYWVAMQGNGTNGRPLISRYLTDLFESGDFIFVDLAQFKTEIMRIPWVEKPNGDTVIPAPVAPAPIPSPELSAMSGARTIKVTMELAVREDRALAIQHSIGSLMGNVSRLEGVIKTKTTTEVE